MKNPNLVRKKILKIHADTVRLQQVFQKNQDDEWIQSLLNDMERVVGEISGAFYNKYIKKRDV